MLGASWLSLKPEPESIAGVHSSVVRADQQVRVRPFLSVFDDAYRSAESMQAMRLPGVEPGAQAWEACMLPLHYRRPYCCGPQSISAFRLASQSLPLLDSRQA